MNLLCPLCGEILQKAERSLVCPNRHSFDIARQGYVNLLPVQNKRSLNPGDTKEQVQSRREFLDGGFYAPICEALCKMAEGLSGPVLDVGCGEGYYSSRLAESMGAELWGLDISKEAVRFAAGRYKEAQWLCASAARLPVEDGSVGLLTSLFAVTLPEEFLRVLRPDGAFVQVLAAPDHLLGLKNIIYPSLTEKPKDSAPELPGFTLERSEFVRFSFTVEGKQVQNLLSMTPHVYRISKEGAEALAATETLTDTASCVLNLYRPKK
ncbi:MAG: methyltransferase domain-containing protein [Oscillospiraceae bacterium]|nr:methyltransferase domain-containing protein [Oscillospiraceae bacterium]